MKNILLTGTISALLLAGIVLSVPNIVHSEKQITPKEIIIPKVQVTHAQAVWISALEWCESRGRPTAVNAKDRDGTPSYYSFQFKPSTFQAMKIRYGIEGVIESQEDQQKILEAMVLDTKITNNEWRYSLFPGCVAKLGLPPRY